MKTAIDPDQIWIDLCEPGSRRERALKLCQKFLRIYAERRVRECPSLGPNEKELKRTVTAGVTLVDLWRRLVLSFHSTVLLRKRHEDPRNAAKWSLSLKGGTRGEGPVCDIVRVCLCAPSNHS